MKRFLFGALTMGAVLVLTSFALSHVQDSSASPGPIVLTMSYAHDGATVTNAAYAWEWKGNELVACTRYSWQPPNGIAKLRLPVIEEKK